VTAGLGRSVTAAAMPAPMLVPPPPTSCTWRAEVTRCAGPTAVSQASTRTCTAGGAVDSSSRNSSPRPASASRRAQAGGANLTWSPTTMGSPAKSEGSLIEAMTVSHGRSMACAMARIADVLPVPGAPHSSTGTRAATATPSASTAGFGRSLTASSVGHRSGSIPSQSSASGASRPVMAATRAGRTRASPSARPSGRSAYTAATCPISRTWNP
jgi:hypothetical protein